MAKTKGYPARHGQTWTVDEMFKLCDLYMKPITWHTIGTRMKRTISACQSRMHLLKMACMLHQDKTGDEILENLAKVPETKHARGEDN